LNVLAETKTEIKENVTHSLNNIQNDVREDINKIQNDVREDINEKDDHTSFTILD